MQTVHLKEGERLHGVNTDGWKAPTYN